MDKEEYCRRFVERMVRFAGFAKFDDGTPVVEYAKDAAEAGWEVRCDPPWNIGDSTPEDDADADMSYWGERLSHDPI